MRVLIVEDQTLIALMLMNCLLEAGHDVVGPASSSGEALSLMASEPLDAAFVDVDLEEPDAGLSVARELERSHVQVIFTTAQPDRVRDCGTGIGLFTKPYNAEDAAKVLSLAESFEDAELGASPPSFEWLTADPDPHQEVTTLYSAEVSVPESSQRH
jgi:two-component system, response regulator PdtaR